MNRFYKIIFLTVFFIFGGAPALSAQQSVSAAILGGNVEDSNGAGVAAALISLKNLETNRTQSVLSDESGRFRFAYVPVGRYELKIEKTGFETFTGKLTTAVGQILEIPIRLNVSGVAAEVSVAAETKLFETTRTPLGETILPRDIEDLPLNGRNFLDLALLVPGVSRTNTGSVQRFAETSAVAGTGISVGGQRNLNNSFVVDGSSANDDAADLTGTFYGQEVIREFQVVTGGAVAEFGRASSGFISIVTRSGTNDFRAKLYGFLRSDEFDARNPLAASKDALTQTQYGASFGGRIVADRTFFFSNFEQTRRNDAAVITISPAAVTVINDRLGAVGYPGSRLETGLVPGGFDTTNLFARVDHQLDRKNSLTATYSFYDIDAFNARTVGGLNAVSRGTNLDNEDHTVNLQNVTVFDSRATGELRFQFRRSRLDAPVNDEIGPAVNVSGIASFGTATNSPVERNIDLLQLSDALSRTFGRHSLKVGAEFLDNRVGIVFPGATQGVYTFAGLTNFLSGNYSQFQQAFGAASQALNNPNFGFFAQDEWRARQYLTFNLGLRYDAQNLPAPVKTDLNNFAPRFGLAFSPGKNTVIRANFGIYYDRIPLRAVANALQRDGSKYIVVQLAPGSPGAPVFPNVLAATPSTLLVKPNVTRIDPEIENGYSQQANVQIERALPWSATVSLGYTYLRGLNLILARNANVPTCAASVNANLCRPDANFGNISRYESSGDSYYNALIFSLNKRGGNWASWRVSYTFSKAIDDTGNFFFSTPQNNFDLRDERGLSDNDQRHRLTLSGSLSVPKKAGAGVFGKILENFQFNYIFNYASRLPFNVQTGGDRNGDTNANDRPPGVGRNTGRGFDFASLDLRVARRFVFNEKTNLELLAEGFNVLNRGNYSVPNNIFGTTTVPLASFGRPTAALDARQIQLGFKLNF